MGNWQELGMKLAKYRLGVVRYSKVVAFVLSSSTIHRVLTVLRQSLTFVGRRRHRASLLLPTQRSCQKRASQAGLKKSSSALFLDQTIPLLLSKVRSTWLSLIVAPLL